MIRELNQNELSTVAGGADYTEGYFTLLQGYEVVGYSQTLIGYDTVSWSEPVGLFSTNFREVMVPLYDIQPIYAPLVPVTTTTVTYY
ncbi:hypothetical protein [Candidatus Berkiella aquae]|uniref:Uncharacterized protein n=1 Tax=Candidatus Berkiella aquae TaxID=295108 RepID=A0A0Q9YJL8_9GAMM|nr:hypothetical protein [Candidatus Berkiella aquae]MCS5711324.1 hypothetical protein [Candidatus Berkiella aquae]